MHMKNYPTHLENIEVKGISNERLENLIEDCYIYLQRIYKIY